MNCVFSSHLWLDFTIFDNLSQILADSRVNACACLSPETAILLEKPINLLNYSILAEEEDVEEYSKMELGLMVNDLLRERQQIMQLFQQVDGERRVFYWFFSCNFAGLEPARTQCRAFAPHFRENRRRNPQKPTILQLFRESFRTELRVHGVFAGKTAGFT